MRPGCQRASHSCGIKIVVDAVTDAGGGRLHGVPGQMGVSGGGLNLRMTKQFPNHRQPFAQRQALEAKLWREDRESGRREAWRAPGFFAADAGDP